MCLLSQFSDTHFILVKGDIMDTLGVLVMDPIWFCLSPEFVVWVYDDCTGIASTAAYI